MNRWAFRVGFVAWLCVAVSVTAAPPTETEIKAAIKQLGDERFATREKAMKFLWQAGDAAEALLRDAVSNPDPEIAKRVRVLLERINYRIEPGTPAEVVAMVQKYRDGTADEQIAILNDILKMGSKSHPYLLRLVDGVEAGRRKDLMEKFALDDWRILVPLMADGEDQLVAHFIDRAAAAHIESIVPHYAVLQLLSGRIDDAIPKLRAGVLAGDGSFAAKQLAALYRLKGDWAGVEWAAERGEAADLVRLALMEQGKWADLYRRYTPTPAAGFPHINALGLTAAYHRLAGNTTEFDKMLKQIAEYAAGTNRDRQSYYAAKALMINERTQDAIDLLIKQEQFQPAAELLVAPQFKYKEALALSERVALTETQPSFYARNLHINMLHRHGETAKARDWLERLTKDMAQANSGNWPDYLIGLEYQLGLVPAAEKRLLEMVELQGTNYLGHAFAAVFPSLGERADTLWRLLRFQSPNERTSDTLKRLRNIENREIAANDLDAILRNAVPAAAWMPKNSSPSAFDHLAWTVAYFDRADLAEALLANSDWKDAPASALLYLADTLANAAKWEGAASAYRKIWETDRTAPLPYFLHGFALTKVGKDADGKKIMETAHRMTLGAEQARFYFHEALKERGFTDAARREVPIRARIGAPFTPFYPGHAEDAAAHLAQQDGDFLTAAAIQERRALRYLPTSSAPRRGRDYMTMAATIHALRAKGFLAQGKKTEALAELDRARQIHPTSPEIPILLVADLETAGEKDRAAELFNRVYSVLDQCCRDFPNCADAHNQIAWLSARCRRRLDDAAVHAQKAVELTPLNPSYLDTLAEVQFQRGDAAKATELMKHCMKSPNPNTAYYRQQHTRFAKGDPKSAGR